MNTDKLLTEMSIPELCGCISVLEQENLGLRAGGESPGMRKALEVAKKEISYYAGNNSSTDLEVEGSRDVIKLIDEVLAQPPIDIEAIKKEAFDKGVAAYRPTAKQVQDWIRDAFDEGKTEKSNETAINLLDLPQQIKETSIVLANTAVEIEKLRASIKTAQMCAMEQVTDLKDGDKPKYGNDKARTAAQAKILDGDDTYKETCDKLSRLEYRQKLDEIALACLRDTFRAHIAIAEMG